MADINYTERIKTEDGFDRYFGKTTSEQVLTSPERRFVSDEEMDKIKTQMDNMATAGLTTPDGKAVPYAFSINESGGLRFTYGEVEA